MSKKGRRCHAPFTACPTCRQVRRLSPGGSFRQGEPSPADPFGPQGLFNILGKWAVGEEDGLRLLGGVSRAKFYALKKNPAGALDQDKLQRVSLLVGIFKALNILHSEKLADAWVSLPNRNRIFAGQTPLQFMVKGGLPNMLVVRRLLDARRGGV